MLKKVKGYLRSLKSIRQTRLTVEDLRKQVGASRLQEATRDLFILAAIGARQGKSEFLPRELFANAPEMRKVLTNGLAKDIDGGVNENIKNVLKTPHVSQRNVEDSDVNLITVMRPERQEFWKCVSRSFQYHVPLYYAEMGFFAGYASYFDNATPPAYKKALGFIFDDMGYYFDSRIPSRLETLLNNECNLEQEQIEEAQVLIRDIVGNRITKYNKYVSSKPSVNGLKDGMVLVVDQKRNDASVLLGAANNGTFDRMLEAALLENSERGVYVKPHPDNLFEAGGNHYKQGMGYKIIGNDVSVIDAIDHADVIYTVSSQVGFEALLRGKKVVVFGLPFYAGWGLTDDRAILPRRKRKITIEELFYRACVDLSVYIDPSSGKFSTLADTIDRLLWMRSSEGRKY